MDATAQRLPEPIAWPFPAVTTHDGIPLGNGLFGALLWGEGQRLRITINRADFWDHRGGVSFGAEATYANLRRWLEAGDEASLRRVFEGQGLDQPGEPPRPTRLPMGRVDLELHNPPTRLAEGLLYPADGSARLTFAGRLAATVEAVIPRGRPLVALRLSGAATMQPTVTSQPPEADEVIEYYTRYGFPAPVIDDGEMTGGWVQELPADAPLAVRWILVNRLEGWRELYIAAAYGPTVDEARAQAQDQLDWACQQGYAALANAEASWWRAYWQEAARVRLPDRGLQEVYDLGMYKLAGLSLPGTPAATLQGPWVEEYRLPPWSSDYHFNINVQECYWPAYAGNQLRALEPLWEMIARWQPQLRANARQFLGIEDGLMLNHAVDDRCTGMGGFWAGAVDHGSTAWVAQLMWQYYLYTLDERFLAETAYPFMVGAMRVYEAMLEETSDGAYALPVSVSPEYGGAEMNAWGRNASFQLAIIHFLCRALLRAAGILKREGVDTEALARWRRIDEHLPLGSIAGEGERRELLLWDGQTLAHSHRHHSHLAGLYPFDVFDPRNSPDDQTLLENSFRTWTRMGMGEWSGWCVPWAAILQARLGNGERAALLLEEHRRAYTTRGRATTHDAVMPGLSVIDRRPDIMQIEAAMGATTAILEMLAHTAAGVLYVFPGIPAHWTDLRFENLRTEGAFLVSAERRAGKTAWVRVVATQRSTLRLASPYDRAPVMYASDLPSGSTSFDPAQKIITWDLEPGEELYFTQDSWDTNS